ncbi:acyl CoA--acetate/3-ketoacid CoA transferase subunit beta [Rhizorhabdus wittichii]|uniref:acyl CoA--acetate/3-ketoacid CoA transferase subunit beta n=1 Tax=Rhizorhabdus wittichii TaxID=160791 RepID=UPI00031F7CE5|nr:acyl CoA--acetate/3-ketoacid CoA transferase subunit beta [Rhizorhabdus wittichii]
MTAPDHMLSELLIVACSEVFRNNGEIVATGIGPIPRVAAGLAKTTHSPELLMTDGEAYLVEEPVPIGPRGYDDRKPSGYLPFSRYFDSAVWTGRRHALVSPIQIDRFGQMNLSYVGGTFDKPKVQMLGVRGFPGNTIHHINSMFVPAHSTRIFVPGEVQSVSSVGYNPARRLKGADFSGVDLRFIVTDLCVMDFGGPDHAIRLVSLHDGVTLDQVREATGFDLLVDGTPPVTPAPTEEQLAIIARLDPHNIRATVLKGNPPGKRS